MDECNMKLFNEVDNKISETEGLKHCDNDTNKLVDDTQVVPDGDQDLFGNYDVQKEVHSQVESPNVLLNDENFQISNSFVTPILSDAESRMKKIPKVPIKVQRKLTARKKTARIAKKKLQFGKIRNKKLDFYSQKDNNSSRKAQTESLFGVWVECVLCMKWRYLKNVKDPVEIVENWNCSMIPNSSLNTCYAEPDDWTDEMDVKCAYNKFVRGSIVWAKFKKIPWWPGVVDNDPDEGRFFRTNGNKTSLSIVSLFDIANNGENELSQFNMCAFKHCSQVSNTREYHVVFWDTKVWRSWIPANKMQPFGPNGGTRINLMKALKYYSKRIEAAQNLAIEASEMTLKERIEKFGFAHSILSGNYFGNERSRKSSVEMDKDNLRKHSRKLSPDVNKENLRKVSRKLSDREENRSTGKELTLKNEKDESDSSSKSPKSQNELTQIPKLTKKELQPAKLKFVPQFKRNAIDENKSDVPKSPYVGEDSDDTLTTDESYQEDC